MNHSGSNLITATNLLPPRSPHTHTHIQVYETQPLPYQPAAVMGGAVSSGKDNSELVDNLCYEDYIQTPCIERVFRMIDRADYMLFQDDEDRLEAYEDHAWRRGTLHLSAPCIYTRALEALKLERGVSFLNIGSGTGYFSTMAGMLIGPFGINHGIELFPENVEYAHEKLQEFKENSRWYNPTEFCDPVFIVGNGLLLSPGNILYDRIYCGAAGTPSSSGGPSRRTCQSGCCSRRARSRRTSCAKSTSTPPPSTSFHSLTPSTGYSFIYYSTLQYTTVYYSILQYTTVYYSILQYILDYVSVIIVYITFYCSHSTQHFCGREKPVPKF